MPSKTKQTSKKAGKRILPAPLPFPKEAGKKLAQQAKLEKAQTAERLRLRNLASLKKRRDEKRKSAPPKPTSLPKKKPKPPQEEFNLDKYRPSEEELFGDLGDYKFDWGDDPDPQEKEVRARLLQNHDAQARTSSEKRKANYAHRGREAANAYQKDARETLRDIGELPVDDINWDRRMACKTDLALFFKLYLPNVFYMDWSLDQLRCIKKLEEVNRFGGMFALAMPRGGGKTAAIRGGTIWSTAYGYRSFPFLINSSEPKAIQTLNFIKAYWYSCKALQQDFPEIGYPILRVENRWHLAKGQLYNGIPTHIVWGSDSVQYPSLILPKEVADVYKKYDPGFIRTLPHLEGYITRSAGTMIRTAGITGSIRGEAEVHPVLLTQPRPDLVILDDIQKDQSAESPAAVDKLAALVDGSIQGLAGPGKKIAALMPCTVIRENDLSDQYVNPKKKPQWRGERCRMVLTWPEGISDHAITLETPAGECWNRYAELRKESYLIHGDIRLATEYYLQNREIMDAGFTVSWTERYGDIELQEDGSLLRKDPYDISAQQHAMNLRLENPRTFPPEFQNIGRSLSGDSTIMISSAQLAEKTIANLPKRMVPGSHRLVAFIDVQNEILFYTVFAFTPEFSGVITDYNTFPKINSRYFHKHQTEGWGMLSRQFLTDYPNQVEKTFKDANGRTRVPLDAKIYHALGLCVKHLLNKTFIRDDGSGDLLQIEKIGIDARNGKVTEVIKRFCKEWGTRRYHQLSQNTLHNDPDPNAVFTPKSNLLIPMQGIGISAHQKQMEEYTVHDSWITENRVNPLIKQVKWLYKPDAGGQYVLQNDVNRWKTFLFQRLSSPPGASGSISLFDAEPEAHQMFCDHICNSEYPEEITARGAMKEMWLERDGRPDNDYLDCTVGCLTLASFLGAFVRTEITQGKTAQTEARNTRKLSRLWDAKRRMRD